MKACGAGFQQSRRMIDLSYRAISALYWITIVAGTVAILSAAVSAITPLEGRDWFEVANDFTSLDVSTFSDGRAKLTVVGGWAAVGVASLAWAALFGQLRAVLSNVKADRPFATANARYMAFAGWVVIGVSVTSIVGESVGVRVSFTAVDILGFKVGLSFDGTTLVVGMLLLVLAGVFRHGAYLQQEHDDTV